jgi:hypothetical protein
MNAGNNTSLITILSSTHGRLRREQRDIDKRELRRAVKYGTRERAWGQRWRFEYDGIVFITDESMRREVTAFPAPLPEQPVDFAMRISHGRAKRLLAEKPELSTSHTVIVIDNSGSMLAKKNSIHLYRDSQNAAFSMAALEFVAEQLFNKTAVNSDLISLVNFSQTASVSIEREPIDWPVYNKLLSHRNFQKFAERQLSPYEDEALAGSNYLPALQKASDLLEAGYHEKCAVSLFFFSDGQSTDHKRLLLPAHDAKSRMCDQIDAMASQYGDALTVTFVGLGDPSDDFSVLEAMASAANKAGAKGSFEFCNKTANSIASAISSTVSSTTETRTTLLEGGQKGKLTTRDLKEEKDAAVKFDWSHFRIVEHLVYDPVSKGFPHSALLPLAAAESFPEEAVRRTWNPPPFLFINRNYFGKGAERLAFRCRLSDTTMVNGFTFGTMVAKETKDVERINEKVEFHGSFMETQQLANCLAKEFNKHLRGLPHYDPAATPQIKFLECSILLVDDPTWPTGQRGVLVEKMLDTEHFPWTKWNDNNGMVDGKHTHMPIDVDFELKQLEKEKEKLLQTAGLGAITEVGGLGAITEDDEEEDSDEDASVVEEEDDLCPKEEDNYDAVKEINPSDYLQAFTHFTYRYTNKKVLVCDLQGVFNTNTTPPTFELTDPAIHYTSTRGRRMVYGRTDKGMSGVRSFFKTHKCTKICKHLELSAKNKKWKVDWRRESAAKKDGPTSRDSAVTKDTPKKDFNIKEFVRSIF